MKNSRIIQNKILAILLILILALGLMSGCKRGDKGDLSEDTKTEEQSEPEEDVAAEEQSEPEEDAMAYDRDDVDEDGAEASIYKAGKYNSKEDVALYLHLYGQLPDNYITKKEAQNMGWSGGSVEKFGEGFAIGGDNFGNYEGLLPEGPKYHECDVDTWGKSKRGAKRIIWSDDGYIYYTEDHYESFELLYEGN